MVIAKFGIDDILLSLPILRNFRFLLIFNPWYWRASVLRTRGEKIRLALEQLGPIFVKFGQMLSLRSDLLPEDIIIELAKLQDQVLPFSGKLAVKTIEEELNQPIDKLFLEFEEGALASASIAQVHAAKLWDQTEIVVKVLRPGIEKIIRQDVELLYSCARILDKYWQEARRFHPVQIVAEFERNIMNELDLQCEAANASQLRRNFQDSKILYIPKVFWEFSSKRIMVLERVFGIPIADFQQLKKHNMNLKKLAERSIELFFTQVFRDQFFHADMHPGNLFVNPKYPDDPQYIAVDFGIMGSLNSRDQRYLAENFMAFFQRDYYRVAELHIESGWVPADVRPEEFANAMRAVCEPIFERPLKDISFGKMLMRLIQTARQFRMDIQPQLILLQKTLLNIEGLGRQLYPELDLWQTARPHMEKWMNKQLSPKVFLKKMYEKLPYLIDKSPEIPGLIYDSLHLYVNQMHENKCSYQNKQQSISTHSISNRNIMQNVGLILMLISLVEIYFGETHLMRAPLSIYLFCLTFLIGFYVLYSSSKRAL